MDSQEWACGACTFRNAAGHLTCNMCGTPREDDASDVAAPPPTDSADDVNEADDEGPPPATPAPAEAEYLTLIANVTARHTRGDGILFVDASLAVEAANEHFGEEAAQAFIRNKLAEVLKVYLKVLTSNVSSFAQLRLIWRQGVNDELYLLAFERAVLSAVRICLKLLEGMADDATDQSPLQLMELLVDRNHKLYCCKGHAGESEGHPELYARVCAMFRDSGCFVKLLARIHLELVERKNWGQAAQCLAPFVQVRHMLLPDVALQVPCMLMASLQSLSDEQLEEAATNEQLGEMFATVAKLGDNSNLTTPLAPAALGAADTAADDEQKQLSGGEANVESLVVRAWQFMASRCFFSEKLRMRRFGCEQIGSLAASQLITREQITAWVRDKRILEDMLGPRIHPRVVPCADKLLANIDLTPAILDSIMAQIGTTAVQTLLGTLSARYDFDATLMVHVLDTTRTFIEQGSGLGGDAFNFTNKFLGSEVASVSPILFKGSAVALPCLDLLWAAMRCDQCSASDTDGFLRTLVKVASHMHGKSHREALLERCIDIIRASMRASTERHDVQIALRVIEKVCTTFPVAPTKIPLAATSHSRSAALLRAEFIEQVEHKHQLSTGLLTEELEVFVSQSHGQEDQAACLADVRARLELLKFLHVGSGLRMPEQQISRLWGLFTGAPSSKLAELFFHWLRDAQDSVSHASCFSPQVLGFVLRTLFCQQTDLAQLRPRGFHCLQAIFVSVNNNKGRFVAEDSEAMADGMVFKSSGPPEHLRGKRMIGSRIRVQWKDEKMHEGVVVAFDVPAYSQKHRILYNNGNTEEHMLSLLDQWHLLGAEDEARAGPVAVTKLNDEDLTGLEAVWTVFLRAVDEEVSRAASDLLFNVYDMMTSVQTADSRQRALEERQALLANLPGHRIYEEGDMVDVQHFYGSAVDPSQVLCKWRKAQVTDVTPDCVSICSITVSYVEFDANREDEVSLLSQHEEGVTDDGSAGPRLAPIGTASADCTERLLSVEEVAMRAIKLQKGARPVAKLPGSDCRGKLVDRLFGQLERECTASDISAALVHRTVVLLKRFLGHYSAKSTARSHLGCGRGQPLLLTLTQGFGMASLSDQLPVHGKITLIDLRKMLVDMFPAFTLKTLQIHHRDKVLHMSEQTLEEVGVGPSTATLALANSKAGHKCKSCYHIHVKGDCCGAIVSVSHDNTRKTCICTAKTVVPPRRKGLSSSARAWSPANDLSASRSRFLLLLDLLERPLDSTTRKVLWRILIATPTNREEQSIVASPDMDWSAFFEKESYWRVIYSLHIVDAHLLPADEADRAQADAWRKQFIESTGFASLFQFFVSLDRQPCWTAEPLAAAIGLPVILRILNFCVAGSLGAAAPAAVLADSAGGSEEAQLSVAAARAPMVRQFSERSGALVAKTVDFRELASHLVTTVQHVHALMCSETTMALVPREIAVQQAAIDGMTSLQTIFRSDHALAVEFFETKMDFVVHDLLLRSSSKRIREKTSSALLEMSRLQSGLMARIFAQLNSALNALQPSSKMCSEYFALFAKLVSSARAARLDAVLPELSTLGRRIVQRLVSDDAPLASSPGEDFMLVGLINLLVPLANSGTGGGIESPTRLLRSLFHDFLMTLPRAGDGREPRCMTPESRQATFRLLHALVRDDPDMQLEFVSMMTKFVNRSPAPVRRKDRGWEFEPDWEFEASASEDVSSQCKMRNATEQVGLLNRGMTCYVNSILQQLYRLPKLRHAILSLPPPLPKQTKLPTTTKPMPVAGDASDYALGAGLDEGDATDATPPPDAEVQTPQHTVSFENNFDGYDDDLAAAMKASMQDAADPQPETKASEPVPEEQGNTDKGEVIRQLQRAFLFMQDGRQGCFEPYPFVMACNCLNLNFRVTSQNDATELYDKVVDCIEDGMKGSPQLEVMKQLFGGEEVRQKTCHKCKQTFSVSSAAFNRLELQCKDNDIMKKSLVECLEVFTQPEVMKGDNQVFCEACQAKCDMTFGTCIHTLPNVLPLHLKRFDFDVRTFRTVKLNQSISFPLELDMHLYTEAGIQQREKLRKRQATAERKSAQKEAADKPLDPLDDDDKPLETSVEALDTSVEEADIGASAGAGEGAGAQDTAVEASSSNSSSSSSDEESDDEFDAQEQHCWYDLVGTVVHRGQAGGGHYYSFAKDEKRERWYKLNDDKVSVFDPSSKSDGIEAECFGGEEERTVTAYGYSTVETCERDNNALMLFYVRRGFCSDEVPSSSSDGLGVHGRVQPPQLARQRSDPGNETGEGTGEGIAQHAATPPLVPSLQRSLSHSEAHEHKDRHVGYALAGFCVHRPVRFLRGISHASLATNLCTYLPTNLLLQAVQLRSEMQHEVWKRNDELRRQQLLFDPTLFQHLLEILQDTSRRADEPSSLTADAATPAETAQSTEARVAVVRLGTIMFVDVILRSKSRACVNPWVQALEKLYRLLPQASQWLLCQVTGEKRLPWLQTLLFECADASAREGFSRLVKCALSTVATECLGTALTPHVDVLADMSSFVVALQELMPSAAQNWSRAAAYVQLWQSVCVLAPLCPPVATLLQERSVVATLCHLYLGSKSPCAAGSGLPTLTRVGVGQGMEPEFGGLLTALQTLMDCDGMELSPLSLELWQCNELIKEIVQRNPLLDGGLCGPTAFGDSSLLTAVCRGSLDNSANVITCLIESMSDTPAEIYRRTPAEAILHAKRKVAYTVVLAIDDAHSSERVLIAMAMLLKVMQDAVTAADSVSSQAISVGQLAELLCCMNEHPSLAAAVAAAVDQWSWLVDWLDNDSSPTRQGANSSQDVRDVVTQLDKMRCDLLDRERLLEHHADGLAISVSDCGTDYANGTYYYHGRLNGHPLYRREAMAPASQHSTAWEDEKSTELHRVELYISRKYPNNGRMSNRDYWSLFKASEAGGDIGTIWDDELYASDMQQSTSASLVPPAKRVMWNDRDGDLPLPIVRVVVPGEGAFPAKEAAELEHKIDSEMQNVCTELDPSADEVRAGSPISRACVDPES